MVLGFIGPLCLVLQLVCGLLELCDEEEEEVLIVLEIVASGFGGSRSLCSVLFSPAFNFVSRKSDSFSSIFRACRSLLFLTPSL